MPDEFLKIEGVKVVVKELLNDNTEKNVQVIAKGGIISFEVIEENLYRVSANKDGYNPFLETKRGSELASKPIQLIPLNK